MYNFENGGILLHRTIDVHKEKYFYCWTANYYFLDYILRFHLRVLELVLSSKREFNHWPFKKMYLIYAVPTSREGFPACFFI